MSQKVLRPRPLDEPEEDQEFARLFAEALGDTRGGKLSEEPEAPKAFASPAPKTVSFRDRLDMKDELDGLVDELRSIVLTPAGSR